MRDGYLKGMRDYIGAEPNMSGQERIVRNQTVTKHAANGRCAFDAGRPSAA